MHQEHVEEPHGGRRASTANNGFHGLGLRYAKPLRSVATMQMRPRRYPLSVLF